MQTGALVAALTGAGIVGGIAGALVAQGGPRDSTGSRWEPVPGDAGPSRDPAPDLRGMDESVARELTALRARLDELQASVATASAETTRLQAELVKEREASAARAKRIETLESAGAAAAAQGPAFGRAIRSLDGDTIRLEGALSDRMKKSAELRALPEEERWSKAREALGLSGGQEEELKAAIKERAEAMRAAVVVENRADNANPGAGEALTVRMPDMEKIRDARTKYEERVNATLTPEQSKKWRDEGYESALGVRGGMLASAVVVEGER